MDAAARESSSFEHYKGINEKYRRQLEQNRQTRSTLRTNLQEQINWIARHTNIMNQIYDSIRHTSRKRRDCNWWKSFWTGCSRGRLSNIIRYLIYFVYIKKYFETC